MGRPSGPLPSRRRPKAFCSGDLPNLHAGADGKAIVDAIAPGVTLTGGGKSLLDQDGATLVIHPKADDYRTDQRATRATASSAGCREDAITGPDHYGRDFRAQGLHAPPSPQAGAERTSWPSVGSRFSSR